VTAGTDLRFRAAKKLPAMTAHTRGVIRVVAGVNIRFMTCLTRRLVLLRGMRKLRIILLPRINADETERDNQFCDQIHLRQFALQTGMGFSMPTHFTNRSLRFEIWYGFSEARSLVLNCTSQFHVTSVWPNSVGTRFDTT